MWAETLTHLHQLLTEECAPTALDQVLRPVHRAQCQMSDDSAHPERGGAAALDHTYHLRVYRICAVDGDIELRVLVHRGQWDVEALGLLLCSDGGWNLAAKASSSQPHGQAQGAAHVPREDVTATMSVSSPEESSWPTRSTAKYAVEPVPSPIFMPERT